MSTSRMRLGQEWGDNRPTDMVHDILSTKADAGMVSKGLTPPPEICPLCTARAIFDVAHGLLPVWREEKRLFASLPQPNLSLQCPFSDHHPIFRRQTLFEPDLTRDIIPDSFPDLDMAARDVLARRRHPIRQMIGVTWRSLRRLCGVIFPDKHAGDEARPRTEQGSRLGTRH